jgi:hypothetical protein
MVFAQIADYVVDALGLEGALRAAAHFWVYDTLKILAILTAVIFGVTYLRTYFPPEKIREYLDGKTAFTGYALAAVLGIVSPFCSCSTIPIFLGMVGAGIPFGITMTFLAVSPMINEAALVVLPGVVGLKLTAIYAVSGITIGMTSGYTLNRLGFDRYVDDFEFGDSGVDLEEPTRRERLRDAYAEAKHITLEIVSYVTAGVGGPGVPVSHQSAPGRCGRYPRVALSPHTRPTTADDDAGHQIPLPHARTSQGPLERPHGHADAREVGRTGTGTLALRASALPTPRQETRGRGCPCSRHPAGTGGYG